MADYTMNRLGYGNGQLLAAGDGGRILACDTKPRLGPFTLLPNGVAQVAVAGISGLTYSLEASTNLADWSTVTNAVATNGTGTFTDWSATASSPRFYRAASQP